MRIAVALFVLMIAGCAPRHDTVVFPTPMATDGGGSSGGGSGGMGM